MLSARTPAGCEPRRRDQDAVRYLVLGLLVSALGSLGHRAPGGEARPPLVVTQLPPGTAAEKAGPRSQGMRSAPWGDGARLVLLAPDGSNRVLSTSFHSACDPDVSFDAQRLLFAGKRTAADPWNVFEMTLADGNVHQITRDLGDCRSPIYLSTFYTITEQTPWDQIGFVAARADGHDEFGGEPATALHTCKLDGSFVQRITHNLSSDFDPAILPDGRLLYATWHRATFDNGLPGRIAIEGINVDGSDRAPYVPAGRARIQHMPCITSGGLAVFVESERLPWDGAGRLACVSNRRPLHTYRALTEPQDALYAWPAPLPDGRIVVARRPADGRGTHGLFAVDLPSGKAEPLFDDPAYHDLQARAVAPRPRPDGRSSVVAENDSQAKLYGLDLYTTEFNDPGWLPRGTVKTLRVLEGLRIPPEQGAPEVPQLAPRRILAEVPVEADGSFHLTVPANTPLQLQIVDDQGLALRSCGWIWARSHQAQGCIGCHEDPEQTPENRVPLALQGPGLSVNTPVEQRVAVDFRTTVAPIVASRCRSCHAEGGAAPRLDADGRDDAGRRQLYEALLAPEPGQEGPVAPGRYVRPGQARTSPLVWHIYGKNLSRPWDGPVAGRAVKPLPASKDEPITDAERQAIVRWIDLGAAWSVAPGAAGSAR